MAVGLTCLIDVCVWHGAERIDIVDASTGRSCSIAYRSRPIVIGLCCKAWMLLLQNGSVAATSCTLHLGLDENSMHANVVTTMPAQGRTMAMYEQWRKFTRECRKPRGP